MEVILIQDVKSLGKKGDLVKVNDGYARNFILPKKLGIEATNKNINDLKLQKQAEKKQEQDLLEEAKAYGEKLSNIAVQLEIKAGEGGRTFGSVSTKEIAAGVKKQFNLDVDRKRIQLSEPIKNVGEYEILVKLHPKVTAKIKVIVKAV